MELAGRKILVTGAGGFIGSHLVEAISQHDCTVRCFIRYNSKATRGWLDSLPQELLNKLEIVAGDLKDPDAVRGAVSGCDVVFHLAALIGIPYSYSHPRDYVDTNIVGTTNLLSACRDHNVARLIHVSTSEVYGTAQYVPIDENHPRVGQSPYSASKIAADMLVESFHRSFDLPAVIIRPFNTFGPRQSLRAVIPTIIVQLLRDSKLKLGDLHPSRDFTFVEDTVSGLLQGAEVDAAIGNTINLGTGEEITIGRLVELIADIVGAGFKVETEHQRLRPAGSEVERLISDNSRARELLAWKPRTSLEEGLRRTISWFRDNLTGLREKEYIT